MPDREETPRDYKRPIAGEFWRRVNCQRQLTSDPKYHGPGVIRPKSDLFEDGKDEFGEPDPVSAFNAVECASPKVALENHEGFGLVMITKEMIVSCGLSIVSAPRPGPPGHVLLIGNKTRSIRTKLALSVEWVVRCPDVIA